jgi:hypothetical protein
MGEYLISLLAMLHRCEWTFLTCSIYSLVNNQLRGGASREDRQTCVRKGDKNSLQCAQI